LVGPEASVLMPEFRISYFILAIVATFSMRSDLDLRLCDEELDNL
jgi:hypothetical protein